MAAVFALFTFLIGEFVVPPLERTAEQIRLREKGRAVGQDLRSGLWVKDDRRFINVQVVCPVRVCAEFAFMTSTKMQLRSVMEALEASMFHRQVGD